jgi:hypothetical protein
MEEKILKKLYIEEERSVADIASLLEVSQNKVNYWIAKYKIPKRTISEAVYLKKNPEGDPFLYKAPCCGSEWVLFGMGLGLYWGEGNKKDKNSLRLGNSDPRLIKTWIAFLEKTFCIDRNSLKFGLQLFSDVRPGDAKNYWIKELGVLTDQFYKVTVTPTRGDGTYKKKSPYGVLTVYFNNTKMSKYISSLIENFEAV